MSDLTGTDQDPKFSEEFREVNLTKWNPMLGDYSSKEFNSYFKPTAPEDFKAIYKKAQSPQSAQVESFSPTKGDKQDINLFIGNVPLSLSKEGLKSFLSQAAPVNSVRICTSKDPERGTTFGFARVTSPRDAENIIKRFNNFSFGTTSNLFVKLGLSTEERERQREIQREEEEFYLNLYKNTKVEEKETSVAATESKSVKMHGSDANSAMSKKNSRICVCCNKPGSKQCARCKACYCSSDCQRMDWAKHQKQCLLVGSPNSKETSTSNASASNSSASNGEVKKVPNKNPGDIAEDSLLLAVDEMGIQENMFYYISDLKAPKPLEPTIRVMIYVVDGLIMKGQAISETDTTALLQMTERLGKYVLVEPDMFQDGECKEGMLVIIDYHGEISRARIVECKTRSSEVEIFFIDYGNTEVCKISDLKPLPEFALALPIQCREFTLHNMPEITNGNIKELLSQHLKELVQEKLLIAETKLSTHGTYQLIVAGEDGCSVNESMLSLYKDLASKSTTIASHQATKSVTDSNSAQPAKWTNDIPIEPLPKEPDFKIVVTDVKSPMLFFAQVVSADLSNLTELANISERLQENPSANGSGFKPTQGQACIAFFPEDQMWYRASIESINNDGTIHVAYFDYGNTANIDTCFLRPISGEFLSLPRQARKFCLSGVKSSNADGNWSKAAIDLFREKASLEPCEVYNDGMVNDVCQLRVYFSSDDCCADELLIKHGFAVSTAQTEQSNQSQAVPVNAETKKASVEKFSLKPRKVDVHDELRVVVVHVEDPDCLYVSIIEKEAVEKLMEYSGRLHEVKLSQLENPQPGDACVALYTDGDWYRAKVVSVGKDSCVVFFSDYGNHSEITNTSLKIIPEEVRPLPAQAVKVKLHDVIPRSDTNTWSDTGKEYFSGLIADKICQLKVVSVEVDLAVCILIGEDDGCDFAKDIIKAGIAQNVKEVSEKPRAEKFSLRPRKVEINEELRAAVSHVEDPDCFYVNVIEREAVEKLMEYSGCLHDMKLSQLETPQPGDACVALYTDGDWYRAKVVSVFKDSCVVFFSDYGNQSDIANKSLKVIPDEVRSLPAQAVKVKLHDVMPKSDTNTWSDRAKEYFSGLIADKICLLKVFAVADGVASCSAVCEDDGCDAAKEIIKAGIAQNAHEVSKKPRAEKFSLRARKVEVNEKLRAAVSHVEDPDCFYVNVVEREAVEKLMEYSGRLHEVKLSQLETPQPGDACVALYTDGDWYRAKIVSVFKDSCVVFFSDYGNQSEIANKSLKVIPDEVRSLPAQAVKVKLHDVMPKSDTNTWSDRAKEYFSSLIADKICLLKVLAFADGVASCSAVCEDDGCDVAKEIIKAGIAQNAQEVSKKPSAEKFSLRPRKVEVNEELRAAVSHVEDPDCFYVNVVEREAVEKLMEYSGRLHEVKLSQLETPQPGDACVALYTDGDWYRAKVVSARKESCVVFFSDYGNQSEIANKSLKVLPEEVRSLPAQAVKVKLHDVMPRSDTNTWSDRAKEYFAALIADKICILKVFAVADGVAVCSAVCEDDGCDVAKEIVKAGLARSASVALEVTATVKPAAEAKNRQNPNETSKNPGGRDLQVESAVRETNMPVVQEKKKISEPVQEEKPLTETKKTSPFTSFNKANGQAANASNNFPEQKNSKTEHNGKVSDSSESDDSNQQVNRPKYNRGRGRGRGRGNFGNRNQGSFMPPLPPFPFYPYMHFPVPSDEDEAEDQANSYGDESKGSSKNKSRYNAALMQQQADFMQQMWAVSMRGRGRGGARGGFNRSQNGFNDAKHHSKLPQEQIPSEYTRGANIEFIVSCIYSPSRFYVIKDGTNDKLPMETYQNAVAPATIEEGLICAVLVGGSYYRALVNRVYKEKISVKLVDSGRDEIVNRSALKRLVPEDFKRPFLAVRSVLHNAAGLGKNRWSSEAIHYFTHKIDIADRKMKGIVCGEVPSGLLIDIIDPENSKKLIVDDLVQLGFAGYMKSDM